ncbi:MAG: RNA-binding domain-containing protein [Sulfolobales archaeon]
MRISLLEISTIAHATEDLDKVVAAIKNTIPKDLWNELERNMEISPLEGYYGNPVTRIVARLKGKQAENAAKYILSNLDQGDFETLVYTLDRRFDGKGRVFIRISKQDAYLGRLRIAEGDDIIRIVMTLPGARRVEDVEKTLRSLRGG